MLLREHFPDLNGWRIAILATDISSEVLAKAKAGRYNQIEANRGLPAPMLIKYFQQVGTNWQLGETIRNMVEFKELNLARPWPFLPRMDLVFLRNVMIYFEVPVKKAILGQVANVLQPDGYLILGGAETTFSIDDSYQRAEALKGGFYQLATNTKSPAYSLAVAGDRP
jgi:chemotaxis protein methyltransferase CheR